MKDILKDIIGVHCHKFGLLYFAIDYIQHPADDVFITSLVGVTIGSMLCQRATHNLVKYFFFSFMDIVWNQKHIPRQWIMSYINALWKQNAIPEDPYMFKGISIGFIRAKVVLTILLIRMVRV